MDITVSNIAAGNGITSGTTLTFRPDIRGWIDDVPIYHSPPKYTLMITTPEGKEIWALEEPYIRRLYTIAQVLEVIQDNDINTGEHYHAGDGNMVYTKEGDRVECNLSDMHAEISS